MKMIRNLLIVLTLICCQPAFADVTVDINTADKTTLSTMLNGIGEKKAEAIIAYREENGPFKSIEELANVKGIGEATVEKNQDIITIQKQ